MDNLAKNLPEFEVVSKMQGVGRKIRPRIIAEIGDIRNYKSASSLIASTGIDTPPYQSGNFSANNIHISKRGNKYLRKCGYEIMKSLKTVKPTKDSALLCKSKRNISKINLFILLLKYGKSSTFRTA